MSGHVFQALRVGTLLVAAVGGTVILGQVVAGLVVVHVLSSVVQQMLG